MKIAFLYMLLLYNSSFFEKNIDSLRLELKHSGKDNQIEIYLNIAKNFEPVSPESSISNARIALELARKAEVTAQEAEAFYILGNAYRNRGVNDSAMYYYQKAIELFKKNR